MAFAEIPRINGKDKAAMSDEVSIVRGDYRAVKAFLRDTRLVWTGAALVIGLALGAWQLGLFGYDRRIAVLEESDKATNVVIVDLKTSVAEIGRKVDAGFNRIEDRFERMNALLINLAAAGRTAQPPQTAAMPAQALQEPAKAKAAPKRLRSPRPARSQRLASGIPSSGSDYGVRSSFRSSQAPASGDIHHIRR